MRTTVITIMCSMLTGMSAFGQKSIELSNAERQLVTNNNDFAFRLFRQTRTAENHVLSPLSITYALGLLNNGAAGRTQLQIGQVLGGGPAKGDGADAATINTFCRKMLDDANRLDENTKMCIANNIYFNNVNYHGKFMTAFLETAKKYYDAEPEMCDLYAPETLDNINQWVAKHTDGMITNLLNPEDLQPNLVSFLLNAISFKGAWAKPFDKDLTESAPFDGGKATAMMMSQKSEFQYSESSLYQAVRLRYGNGAYFLTVFLPRENQTLDNLVSALNGQNWNNANYERCQVSLKLPRITTDTNQDLNDAMSALGMPDAFLDEKDAEGFTQLCYLGNDEANSDRVWIGLMKQSATLTLDEAGTQAAAATAIEVVGKSAPIGPQVDFVADRPFLYTLSEESTGAIFFIGQYLGDGPAQSGEQNAIHDILKTNGAADAKAYDLQGREAVPQSKGLLIRDGRKIVKK